MKKIFFGFAFASLLLAGCGKEYDDTLLKERVDELEEQVQSNAAAIRELQSKLEEASGQGLTVSVTPVEGGNQLTFSDGTTIVVMNGVDGATGPQGPKGDDGQDASVSIRESADGTSYIISFNNKEYTVKKSKTFSLQMETLVFTVAPGQSQEIPYTVSNGDATVKVFVSAVSGYTAEVDMANNKVVITAPAELPETGFVVITAVKNSTGEESSQYLRFGEGHLEVVADAQTVDVEGGVVTLTVNADCEYTVSIPEDCTWITQVESKATTTSYVYLSVAANDGAARTAEVRLISAAGVKTVVIAQEGKEEEPSTPSIPEGAVEVTPEDISEKLSALTSMDPTALNGLTIHFNEGEYTSVQKLTLDFSEASQMLELNFTGTNAVFTTGGALLELKNVKATFNGITFKACAKPIKVVASDVTLTNCTFENNTISNYGSSLHIVGGKAVVNNCTFTGNTAPTSQYAKGSGAAILMESEATVEVKNCTFSGNKAAYGADIYMTDGNLTVEGCQFSGSEVTTCGGCIAMSSEGSTSLSNSDYTKSTAVVKNCTFTGIKVSTGLANEDDSPGGVISCVYGQVSVEGCTFDGCQGKSGTVVTLTSIDTDTWPFYNGNALLKMNNCTVKNCYVTRLGLIYINGGGFGDNPGRRHVVFVNNTSFINNTSKTGNYGTIAHSGGDGGLIMMNNCTVHGVTLENDGNGFAINTDGYILVSNSTYVADTRDGFFRNGNGNGNIKVINTIGINTKEGATGSIVGQSNTPFVTDGHCIYGPENESTTSFSDPIKNATTATLSGYNWNETTGLVEWNGPAADFSKLAASDFQGLLNGWGPKTPAIYSEDSAGAAFYNWLVSVDAVGKDARGVSRGTSWWPGAYQN